MVTFNIDACEDRKTQKIVFMVYQSGDDSDVIASNIVNGFVSRIVDGDQYFGGRPDKEKLNPFFKVFINVYEAHRDKEKSEVGYRRLDFGSRYTPYCEQIQEHIYRPIKKRHRMGLEALRKERADRLARIAAAAAVADG